MDLIATLDLLLRGAAIMALVVIAIAFGLQRRSRQTLSILALSIAVIAYLAVSSPHLVPPPPWSVPLILLASMVPVLVYWSGVELFVDRIAVQWWHRALAGLIIVFGWLPLVLPQVAVLRGVLALALYLHLAMVVVRTAQGDLVEGRRRFRRWFLGAMAVLGLVIGSVELFGLDADLPDYVYPLHALAFAVMAGAFVIWAFGVRSDLWAAPYAEPTRPDMSGADRAVLTRLQQAMAEHVWQTEGLTIGQLASKLDTPEHRLRRIINQGLGHRNFASFINQHRIEAAKTVLADPLRADVPVLTIAHDVGFASLGPFNRAFREITGQSPTQFRQNAQS